MKIRIGNKLVGEGEPSFIIAEAGSNHDCDIEQAKKLIEVAADSGADAIKFQTFSAGKLVTKMDKKMYEFFKKVELPREWHRELAEYANERGIIFLSSTFDEDGADLLEEIGSPAFKIASGELTNLPFISYLAKKGKPLILATGASNLSEIWEAIGVIYESGNKEIILLHCIADYPASLEDVNLKAMVTMKEAFQLPVGFSDHTLGISASLAAAALGATVIEKHFTLDKNLIGPDHLYALNPDELEKMVIGIREVEKSLGSPVKKCQESELQGRKFGRRSIFARVDIAADTVIEKEMLAILRPAIGIEPKNIDIVVGRKAKVNIKKQDPITWDKI